MNNVQNDTLIRNNSKILKQNRNYFAFVYVIFT